MRNDLSSSLFKGWSKQLNLFFVKLDNKKNLALSVMPVFQAILSIIFKRPVFKKKPWNTLHIPAPYLCQWGCQWALIRINTWDEPKWSNLFKSTLPEKEKEENMTRFDESIHQQNGATEEKKKKYESLVFMTLLFCWSNFFSLKIYALKTQVPWECIKLFTIITLS